VGVGGCAGVALPRCPMARTGSYASTSSPVARVTPSRPCVSCRSSTSSVRDARADRGSPRCTRSASAPAKAQQSSGSPTRRSRKERPPLEWPMITYVAGFPNHRRADRAGERPSRSNTDLRGDAKLAASRRVAAACSAVNVGAMTISRQPCRRRAPGNRDERDGFGTVFVHFQLPR